MSRPLPDLLVVQKCWRLEPAIDRPPILQVLLAEGKESLGASVVSPRIRANPPASLNVPVPATTQENRFSVATTRCVTFAHNRTHRAGDSGASCEKRRRWGIADKS